MSKDVTVLLFSCNRSQFLREALDGIAAQQYKGWKLLYSDASDDQDVRDECIEIFDSFSAENPDLEVSITLQDEKLQQGDHSNAQLSKVDTEFVAFHDDDDIWKPDHLEKAVEWLSREEQNGLYISNNHSIDENGSAGSELYSEHDTIADNLTRKERFDYFFRRNYGSTSGFVLRRRALKGHRIFNTSCVDVHFAITVTLNRFVVHTSQVSTIWYRIHSGSAYGHDERCVAQRHRFRSKLFFRHPLRLLMAHRSVLPRVFKSLWYLAKS